MSRSDQTTNEKGIAKLHYYWGNIRNKFSLMGEELFNRNI